MKYLVVKDLKRILSLVIPESYYKLETPKMCFQPSTSELILFKYSCSLPLKKIDPTQKDKLVLGEWGENTYYYKGGDTRITT